MLLQGDGGLGRKKQPRNHKWRSQGEVSWARYILDGSKTVWRHTKPAVGIISRWKKAEFWWRVKIIRWAINREGENREKPKLGHLREWKKWRSDYNEKRLMIYSRWGTTQYFTCINEIKSIEWSARTNVDDIELSKFDWTYWLYGQHKNQYTMWVCWWAGL